MPVWLHSPDPSGDKQTQVNDRLTFPLTRPSFTVELTLRTESRCPEPEVRSMEAVRERLATPARGRVKHWPAFNLFRHKRKSHLVCAVPEDHPVPSFIEGSTWEFAGTVSEPTTVPLGFSRKAADAG